MPRVFLLMLPVVLLAAPQLPPPSLVENGDARAGESHWVRSRDYKPPTARRMPQWSHVTELHLRAAEPRWIQPTDPVSAGSGW